MTHRILAVLATALLVAGPLSAQNDPRLVAAVRLAQDGLSDSARTMVARLRAATQPTDSLYPEVLYTAGLLAASERERRLELRRVVVDYGQSAWADDALLQLAQLDYATGNAAATVSEIEQLLRDYPNSPVTAQAAFWGARAAGDRREGPAACRMADQGLAAVGADVELRNQLEFQKQRCQSITVMAADSARRALADSLARARADSLARKGGRTGANPRPAATTSRSGFYVQISAVADQAAANAEVARAKRAGYATVVVRDRGYLKVRTGPFATRALAGTAATQVKARLGGHPFVVQVP